MQNSHPSPPFPMYSTNAVPVWHQNAPPPAANNIYEAVDERRSMQPLSTCNPIPPSMIDRYGHLPSLHGYKQSFDMAPAAAYPHFSSKKPASSEGVDTAPQRRIQESDPRDGSVIGVLPLPMLREPPLHHTTSTSTFSYMPTDSQTPCGTVDVYGSHISRHVPSYIPEMNDDESIELTLSSSTPHAIPSTFQRKISLKPPQRIVQMSSHSAGRMSGDQFPPMSGHHNSGSSPESFGTTEGFEYDVTQVISSSSIPMVGAGQSHPVDAELPQLQRKLVRNSPESDASNSFYESEAYAGVTGSVPSPPQSATRTPPSPSPTDASASKRRKKSKMHLCEVCYKKFPRPSGLRTHMNTHNNVKPFTCAYPGCKRSFAVRSNAKRHLRTHGVLPDDMIEPTKPSFVVDFDDPVVSPEYAPQHSLTATPMQVRWMPPSLADCTNANLLRCASEEGDTDAEGSEVDELEEEEIFSLSIPLKPVVPTLTLDEGDEGYEERNSYVDAAGLYPYHPSQFNGLPGPALAVSRSLAVS